MCGEDDIFFASRFCLLLGETDDKEAEFEPPVVVVVLTDKRFGSKSTSVLFGIGDNGGVDESFNVCFSDDPFFWSLLSVVRDAIFRFALFLFCYYNVKYM
jgi:hypothetical protein